MAVEYAARCTCGAPAVGSLMSTPGVPIYECGNWGNRACRMAPPAVDRNVEAPNDAELGVVAALLAAFAAGSLRAVAMGPVAVTWDEEPCLCPVIASGYAIHEYGCGRAAP